jgi:hypothetical protein
MWKKVIVERFLHLKNSMAMEAPFGRRGDVEKGDCGEIWENGDGQSKLGGGGLWGWCFGVVAGHL